MYPLGLAIKFNDNVCTQKNYQILTIKFKHYVWPLCLTTRFGY
jgi:hypothetical protein